MINKTPRLTGGAFNNNQKQTDVNETKKILPSELVKLARKQERLEMLNTLQLEINKELQKNNGEPSQRYFTLKEVEELFNNQKQTTP